MSGNMDSGAGASQEPRAVVSSTLSTSAISMRAQIGALKEGIAENSATFKWDAACEFSGRLVRLYEAALDTCSDRLAVTQGNHARLLTKAGRSDEAGEFFDKAIPSSELLRARQSARTLGWLYAGKAALRLSQGQPAEANQLILDAQREFLSVSDVSADARVDLHHTGIKISGALGDTAGMQRHLYSLESALRDLNDNDAALKIAHTLRELGQPRQAKGYLLRYEDDFRAATDRQRNAKFSLMFASTCMDLEEGPEAQTNFAEAFNFFRMQPEKSAPEFIEAAIGLSKCDMSVALEVLKEAEAKTTEQMPFVHPTLRKELFVNLAAAYKQSGDDAQAEAYLEKAQVL